MTVPGVKNCVVTAEWDNIVVACEPESSSYEDKVEYEAELVDAAGSTRNHVSSLPTFKFTGVKQNAVYTINVSVLQYLPNLSTQVEKVLKFSQVISIKEALEPQGEKPVLYEDQMLEKLLPLVGVSGILIFAFIVIMIAISIVRRSRDLFKDKSLHTHIAFNQGIEQVSVYNLIELIIFHNIAEGNKSQP